MWYNINMSRKSDKLKKKVDKAIRDEDFDNISSLIEDTVESAINLVGTGISSVRDYIGKKSHIPSIKRESVVIQKNPMAFQSRLKSLIGIGSMLMGIMFMALFFAGNGWLFLPFGLGLIGFGLNMRENSKKLKNKALRFERYKKELSYSPIQTVKTLADAVGADPKLVRKELDEYITKDYFKQARFIKDKTIFILDRDTFRRYIGDRSMDPIQSQASKIEEEKTEEIEEKSEDQSLEEEKAEDSLKAYIGDLDKIRLKLKDPMASKLDRLITTLGHIYYYLKEDPSSAGSARKFVDYYVPTVIRLLESYINFANIGPGGQNSTQAMDQIEKSMDTINFAFEKFLDDLLADSVIDISSDITVLKAMMQQDGLLEDDFKI